MVIRNKTTNIYTEWLPLVDNLPNETAGIIFKNILKYQNGEDIDSSFPVWLFIKSKIDEYNNKLLQISEKRKENGKLGGLAKASKCYQTLANDTKSSNKIKENKIKENKTEENKYGELGFVRLTTEQYNTLSSKYPSIDKAIEVLDTYLGTSGKKYRNQNHYAFFKSNSWVWERVDNSSKDKKEDSDPTVFIDMDSGAIDITDEANESLSKLGEDSYNKLMAKLRENFNGRNVKRSSISKYIISFEKNERVEQKQDYQYPTLSDFNNLLERNKQ